MATDGVKRLLLAMGGLACAMPIAFGASLARDDGAVAACDEAVVRTLGRGYTGVFHGLDAMATFPLGAQAHWASLASVGLLGLLCFVLAWQQARLGPYGLGVATAFVGTAIAGFALPVQREAVLVFGSVLGAALTLVPVVEGIPTGLAWAAVGLGLSHDVPTGIACVAALGCSRVVRRERAAIRHIPWVSVGLIPIAWMLWRRHMAPEASVDVGWFAGWLGDGSHAGGVPLAVLRAELGIVALGFATVGLVAGLRNETTRSAAAGLLAIVVVGAGTVVVGAPAGPIRYGSAFLAALAALAVLAAGGMSVAARAIATAKVPLARASAAMVVVIELAVPIRMADDTSLAVSKAPADATGSWNAHVFGDLPKNAVLLVPDGRLLLRARAAQATGALRADVMVLPTHGLSSRVIGIALARDALLVPVVRDLTLYGVPEELSLSQLAAARPVLVAFDAGWDRSFAKHLVPQGAFDRYYVEPRGGIERFKASAESTMDEALMALVRRSPALAEATKELAKARVRAANAAGERDYVEAATSELHRIDTMPDGVEAHVRATRSRR
jgi:hypothetical protein